MITRRNTVSLMTQSEIAILTAIIEIEKLPADERLTNAQNKLHEAKELVSNYIDETIATK